MFPIISFDGICCAEREKHTPNKTIKRNLAKLIVKNLYDSDEADKAEQHFDTIFKDKKTPDDIEEYALRKKDIKNGRIWIIALLVNSGLAASNGEARRLISQGAIKIEEKRIDNADAEIGVDEIAGKVIRKGKRYFKKIIID